MPSIYTHMLRCPGKLAHIICICMAIYRIYRCGLTFTSANCGVAKVPMVELKLVYRNRRTYQYSSHWVGAFKFDGSFCICLHFIVLVFTTWLLGYMVIRIFGYLAFGRRSLVTIREFCHEIRLPAVTWPKLFLWLIDSTKVLAVLRPKSTGHKKSLFDLFRKRVPSTDNDVCARSAE